MTAKFFIDTNVLLYAGSQAPEDGEKRRMALSILATPDIGFSAQVLQEFYVAAVTKQRLGMTHAEAIAVLNAISSFPVWPITKDLVAAAILAKERHVVSYWDAAILVAARQLGCDTIFSEDLNHGQDYDGVRVVNPFLASAS